MLCIYQKEYKAILNECFSEDEELLNKYHIEAPASLSTCVEKTHLDLQNAQVQFYTLLNNDKLIGYFGMETGTFLTGFFIKPEYRNKEIIKEFWNIVNNKFNNKEFYCGIYKKNERAMKFLEKNNGRLWMEIPESNAVFFVFNEKNVE